MPKFDLISPETVQLFAESQGVSIESGEVDDSAWAMLAQDLNYRLRDLVSLCSKFMKNGRRKLLTTQAVNAACRELCQEPLRGHSTQEAPKLYYLKEPKLFARNEGVVDLVSLALSTHYIDGNCDSVESGIEGCRIKECAAQENVEELVPSSIVDAEPKSSNNNSSFVSQLIAFFGKETRNLDWESEFLAELSAPRTFLTASTIALMLQSLPKLLDDRPRFLCFAARMVCLLVRKLSTTRDDRTEAEALMASTARLLVDSLIQEPYEDWSSVTCANIGRVIAAISESFPKVDGCCATDQIEKLLYILENPKESPLAYAGALICLQGMGFTVITNSRLNVVACLCDHYKWNKAVFENITPFEPVPGSGTGSFASVAYVGYWLEFVEWYLYRLQSWQRNLLELSYLTETQMSVISRFKQLQSSLLNLALEIFGPLRLPLVEIIGGNFKSDHVTEKRITIPNSKQKGTVMLEAIQEDSHQEEPQIEDTGNFAKKESSEQSLLQISGGKKLKTGLAAGGVAQFKRRKRRLADFFDIPKRRRLEGQGFLFIFHHTDATVLKDRTVKDNAKPMLEKKEDKVGRNKWSKLTEGNKLKRKMLRGRNIHMRPWMGCLDVATLIL